MEPNLKNSKKPETLLQQDVIKILRYHEWFVMPTHGNAYQQGFPDLFCFHQRYDYKWVEVKLPNNYSFTASQEIYFKEIKKVWLMQRSSTDEYKRLFSHPNWYMYIKPEHKQKVFKESKIQSRDQNEDEIVQLLEQNNWTVMRTHGNLYQKGFPDLYAIHPEHGRKWIEIKNPKGFTWTPAQMKYFPLMVLCHVPIWVMRSVEDYKRLFEPYNLREFMTL